METILDGTDESCQTAQKNNLCPYGNGKDIRFVGTMNVKR